MQHLYLLKEKLKIFIQFRKFISEFSGFTFAAFCSLLIDIVFFFILNFMEISYLISQSDKVFFEALKS